MRNLRARRVEMTPISATEPKKLHRSTHANDRSCQEYTKMTFILRFAFLSSLTSVVSFAASWYGALVDASCYASAQNNISHGHPGSTDTKQALRTCSPSKKTTSFSVVPQVGMAIRLDAEGNDKARKLVLKGGNKSPFVVNVTGDATFRTPSR